ncbi:capsular polysaccharide transport system permease protein [Undibacterium sp. GrIS 1.2]|uniref:hypothetical protein n=1 Tax=Undibacterium sp. GrIS 1.2 TaxID=3143933 RepID=UPI00339354AA
MNTVLTLNSFTQNKFIRRILGINRLFLFTVLIPTLVSVIYFGLITSDVYISESKFVVYSPGQSSAASGLSSLLGNVAGNNSTSAANNIHDYIDSWDAMTALNQTYDLKTVYGSRSIDIVNRFGGVLYPFINNVELHRYYRSMVLDSIDSSSGITKLTVRAYSASDAKKINDFLLQKSQDIVNNLNTDARNKAVMYAQQQVDIAEEKLRTAMLDKAKYRNAQKIFSPVEQSALQLTMISKMQDQLLLQQGQLDELVVHAPKNPQLPVLRSSIKSLERQISEESAKVTGSDNSLANKDIKYEGYLVSQLLAQKLLEAATTSLEQAKVTAQKQELYLQAISRPNLPDASQEPKRFQNILATILVALIVWGVLSIVISGVKEHHDR